ncbi:MAG: fibronectin type III domain-containing protein [Candidatus Methylacidiphilales bacterium]|nr:fibronectin type III domain-containing protein [Candidatus Methylacidiphilales bacterium]
MTFSFWRSSTALGVFSVVWCGVLTAQTVTVTAPDPDASESGLYPGLFRLTRTGDTSQPLTVALATSGTGVADEDFEALPATATFAAGNATLDVPLLPINDPNEETGDDTVVLQVLPGAGYSAGVPASATVTVVDNETFTNTSPFHTTALSVNATAIRLDWVDNFENETKYRVQYRAAGNSSWTTIDNLPANTTAHTVSGLTTGVVYEFRVNAYQGSTASQNQTEIRAVPLAPQSPAPAFTTFEQWRVARGLDRGWRAVAGGTTDDPDGDRKNNLLEYLLGTDPWSPDAASLQISAAPASVGLVWPEQSGLLDASLRLEESADLATWGNSTLGTTAGNGTRSATDARGSAARFYRLTPGTTSPATPSAIITCWGDSLTGNPGTYVDKLKVLLPGNRTVQNCGIGGDTSLQIADRLRGVTLTSPIPAYAVSTLAGTPVRLVASRTTHSRIMNTSNRSSWTSYSATIANVSKVEFFNFGVKIGESSTPLSATVTSNRTANPSRLISPGHPYSNGDVVHFPAGPLPLPLIVGKTYYIQNADAGGFSLVEADTQFTVTASTTAPSGRFASAGHPYGNGTAVSFRRGAAPPGLYGERLYYVRDADSGGFSLADTPDGPALTMVYNYSGAVLGPPSSTVVSLAANFSAPTAIRGPFVLDWVHPGGPTSITLRTHTDRDGNTFIFWMGRNNNGRPHEVLADLREAVGQIKALDGRFLIVSVTNGGNEGPGVSYYWNTINLNSLLKKEFPHEFVDIRSPIVMGALDTVEEQAFRADDCPPPSLRSLNDNVHFNDAGQQIIAETLAAEIQARGW